MGFRGEPDTAGQADRAGVVQGPVLVRPDQRVGAAVTGCARFAARLAAAWRLGDDRFGGFAGLEWFCVRKCHAAIVDPAVRRPLDRRCSPQWLSCRPVPPQVRAEWDDKRPSA